MAASYGPQQSLSPVVVLLLGENHSGKSTAGNNILGRQVFHPTTTCSSKGDGSFFRTTVTVVDTPGWLTRSATPNRVSQEIRKGLALCHPGPNVILLVLPVTNTFRRMESDAMQAQLQMLRTTIWTRAIVLFTHGDELGNRSIQDYIEGEGRNLQWLLERCGNRYQVMSIKHSNSEVQVQELFMKIQKMMEVNSRPLEVQQSQYSQIRQEVSMLKHRRLKEDQKECEKMVMYSYPDGPNNWTNSGGQYIPKRLPSVSKPSLSLILLGRRRSGKSSAGNMILGRKEFRQNKKTIRCSVGFGEVLGVPVTVVDTPGWSLFGLANPEQVMTEVGKSPSFCPLTNKVVFLLTVPVDIFSEKERQAIEKYLSVLGKEVWRSTVVMFTYAQYLRGGRVEKLIEKRGEPLQWVLDQCQHRYCTVDTNVEDETQVLHLLESVSTVRNNHIN